MSFLAEQRIARIRPRGSKLFFPSNLLFAACFALAFFGGRLAEQWQYTVLYIVAGSVVFFFWFIPLLRFMSTFLDVTTTRVLYRSGLLGQKRREVSLTQIKDVHLTKGRSISIVVEGQEPLVIAGIPKHKMVAVEIDRLAAAI
jgi:membrane protein YdbS with pleckstrin-like domain